MGPGRYFPVRDSGTFYGYFSYNGTGILWNLVLLSFSLLCLAPEIVTKKKTVVFSFYSSFYCRIRDQRKKIFGSGSGMKNFWIRDKHPVSAIPSKTNSDLFLITICVKYKYFSLGSRLSLHAGSGLKPIGHFANLK
jgi:hypothetical protein